jgi:hypothetical protein
MLVVLFAGCGVAKMKAAQSAKQILDAKEFTVYVNGASKSLTLQQLLSRYDPERKKLLIGMLPDMSGPQNTEVEVLEKVAFDTWRVAYRTVQPVDLEGKTLHPNLIFEVDTSTGNISPLNDEAKGYFAIDGSAVH